MEFKLLGPVQVYTPDGTTDLLSGSRLIKPKHRLMLAALLIAEGNRVGMERLIEQMWGADRDELIGPHSTLHHYASNLRKVLRSADPGRKEDPLPSVANGYRIDIDPRQVDVLRFRDLARRARACSGVDDEEAVRLWRLALAEWGSRRCGLYGPEALAGLRGQWASNYRITLQREHREAMIGLLDAELRIGEHQHVITELAALDAGDGGAPDEDLVRIRMLAYRGVGRSADGLMAYRQLEQSLKQVGREPRKDLTLLRDQIGSGEVDMIDETSTPGEDPLAGESESGPSSPEPSAEGQDKQARLIQEFRQVYAPNSQFGIHY